MKRRIHIAWVAFLSVSCKQPAPKESAPSLRTEQPESLALTSPSKATGSLTLVPIFQASESTVAQFALIECNNSQLERAERAAKWFADRGGAIAPDGRRIMANNQLQSPSVDCHLIHPQAIIDAQSVTLINEKLRTWSGSRVPTRSDLSTFELAQVAWLAMAKVLQHEDLALADSILVADASVSMASRAAAISRIQSVGSLFDPCSDTSPTSPRWLAEDVSLRTRQFECVDGVAVLSLQGNRSYPAVRSALRSALVSLFQESRGMIPSTAGIRGEVKFAISPLVHNPPQNSPTN